MSTITAARIHEPGGWGSMNTIYVTVDGVEKKLRTYFPDELSFTADEFIGMTVDQAKKYVSDADVAYLQS